MRAPIGTLGSKLGLKEEVLARYLHNLLGCLDPFLPENIFPPHLLERAPEGYPLFVDSIHQQVMLANEKRPFTPDAGLVTLEDRVSPWETWSKLAENRVASIIAEPGYGKSMLMQITALRAALSGIGKFQQGAQIEEIEIPILVTFNELATTMGAIQEKVHQKDLAIASLIACVSGQAEDEKDAEPLSKIIKKQLFDGKCCVLIDSWDEFRDDGVDNSKRSGPKPASRKDMRLALQQWCRRQKNRVYATSRICGHESIPHISRQVVRLQGFSPEDASAYITAWFPASQKHLCEDLLTRVEAKEKPIASFTKVPMLCCYLCKIVMQDGQVPETRAELLGKTLHGLTYEWLQETKRNRFADLGPNSLRPLALCAFWMNQTGGENGFRASREVWENQLKNALILQEQEGLRRLGVDSALPSSTYNRLLEKSQKLLDFWSKDCGLLIGKSLEDNKAGMISPLHKTLFDFLAAQAIADCYNPDEKEWGEINVHINNDYPSMAVKTVIEKLSWSLNWQEVLPLAVGIMGQRECDASPALNMWLNKKTDDDLRTRYLLTVESMCELPAQARNKDGYKIAERAIHEHYNALIERIAPPFVDRADKFRDFIDSFPFFFLILLGSFTYIIYLLTNSKFIAGVYGLAISTFFNSSYDDSLAKFVFQYFLRYPLSELLKNSDIEIAMAETSFVLKSVIRLPDSPVRVEHTGSILSQHNLNSSSTERGYCSPPWWKFRKISFDDRREGNKKARLNRCHGHIVEMLRLMFEELEDQNKLTEKILSIRSDRESRNTCVARLDDIIQNIGLGNETRLHNFIENYYNSKNADVPYQFRLRKKNLRPKRKLSFDATLLRPSQEGLSRIEASKWLKEELSVLGLADKFSAEMKLVRNYFGEIEPDKSLGTISETVDSEIPDNVVALTHLIYDSFERQKPKQIYIIYLIVLVPSALGKKFQYCILRTLHERKNFVNWPPSTLPSYSHFYDISDDAEAIKLIKFLAPEGDIKRMETSLKIMSLDVWENIGVFRNDFNVHRALLAGLGSFYIKEYASFNNYIWFLKYSEEDPLPYMRPSTENKVVMDKIKRWIKPRDASKYPHCRLVLESVAHHSLYFSRKRKFYTRDELSDLSSAL